MPNPIDPERPRDKDAFDQPNGYSGQDYTIDREQAAGRRSPAPAAAADDRDLPPDNGRRAHVDPDTGEVHGSGSGAGGGNAGEDLGESSPSGDMYPLTGGEGTNKTPGDLGPTQRDETHYL